MNMIQHKAHKTIGSFTTSFSLLDVSREGALQGETSSFFLYDLRSEIYHMVCVHHTTLPTLEALV